MKIELKNVKYAAFASQETNCFSATIYVDGQKAGDAHNEGCGGPTNVHPWPLAEKLNAYGATLPPVEYDLGEGAEGSYPQTAETLIDDLLTDHLVTKDLKRILAKRVAFTVAGKKGVFQTKALTKERLAQVLEKRLVKDADQILNLMPFDEALKLFKETL